MIMRITWGKLRPGSWNDFETTYAATEQGDLYRKEFAPALQPFFVGDYKTYRCDVKYTQ